MLSSRFAMKLRTGREVVYKSSVSKQKITKENSGANSITYQLNQGEKFPLSSGVNARVDNPVLREELLELVETQLTTQISRPG